MHKNSKIDSRFHCLAYLNIYSHFYKNSSTFLFLAISLIVSGISNVLLQTLNFAHIFITKCCFLAFSIKCSSSGKHNFLNIILPSIRVYLTRINLKYINNHIRYKPHCFGYTKMTITDP